MDEAHLSPGARRSAERALRDVEEGTAPDAYWRARRGSESRSSPPGRWRTSSSRSSSSSSSSPSAARRRNARRRPSLPWSRRRRRPPPACRPATGSSPSTVGRPGRSPTISRRIRSSHGRPGHAHRAPQRPPGDRRPSSARIRQQGRWIFGFSPAAHLVTYPPGRAATHGGIGSVGRGDRHGHRTQGAVLRPGPQPAVRPRRDRPRLAQRAPGRA